MLPGFQALLITCGILIGFILCLFACCYLVKSSKRASGSFSVKLGNPNQSANVSYQPLDTDSLVNNFGLNYAIEKKFKILIGIMVGLAVIMVGCYLLDSTINAYHSPVLSPHTQRFSQLSWPRIGICTPGTNPLGLVLKHCFLDDDGTLLPTTPCHNNPIRYQIEDWQCLVINTPDNPLPSADRSAKRPTLTLELAIPTPHHSWMISPGKNLMAFIDPANTTEPIESIIHSSHGYYVNVGVNTEFELYMEKYIYINGTHIPSYGASSSWSSYEGSGNTGIEFSMISFDVSCQLEVPNGFTKRFLVFLLFIAAGWGVTVYSKIVEECGKCNVFRVYQPTPTKYQPPLEA